MISIVTSDLAPEFDATLAHFLPAIFVVGRLVILADLSLRRNGLADVIDRCLPELLGKLRQEVNQKLEHELAASSQDLAAAMRTCFEKLTVGTKDHSWN
jgi:G:T/U-mismatch repair DNA glycosylase